jgi:hypothetical protein
MLRKVRIAPGGSLQQLWEKQLINMCNSFLWRTEKIYESTEHAVLKVAEKNKE